MLKFVPQSSGKADEPVVYATPDNADLKYVGAKVYHVSAGGRLIPPVDNHHEYALVLVTGTATISGDGLSTSTLQGRTSVFQETPPYVVYISSGKSLELLAETPCEVLWASAVLEGPSSVPSRIYHPSEMPIEARGDGITGRQVRHLLEEPGQAERLRLVEVITPGGHWSSFPPHKHDEQIDGGESLLEELYFYHITPIELWAFQRVYDKSGWGETLAVSDGELVMVPRGYHPVSAPPGSTVYYLNVMAGLDRDWNFTVDPSFSHVPGFSVSHPVEEV